MKLKALLSALHNCPLVASVQADHGAPLDSPESIMRLAQSSVREGVKVIRLQGVTNILAVRRALPTPIVGLIKKLHPGFEPYITPTLAAIRELLMTPCEVVAVDGTRRARADGSSLSEAVKCIHEGGRLALADCDTPDSVTYAAHCGADLISTTLAGYTHESSKTAGPDLAFLRTAINHAERPVLAEGRFSERWQVESAMRIGAAGVVVGGALNDPIKQTLALRPQRHPVTRIGAVDLGGTWLRFGVFDSHWKLVSQTKIATPPTHEKRAAWVRVQAEQGRVERLGISSGGVVDPVTLHVLEAKALLPDHVGKNLEEYSPGVPVVALNDGLATSWGHACHPHYAGRRVATLALGTGVGCGLVVEQRIWMGHGGDYSRINDLLFGGETIESALGGAASPSEDVMVAATSAALSAVRGLYFPEAIVVCGGVGLSPALRHLVEAERLEMSPFGLDAGLYGAAALALFDGWG